MMNPEKSPLVFINYKYRTVFFCYIRSAEFGFTRTVRHKV